MDKRLGVIHIYYPPSQSVDVNNRSIRLASNPDIEKCFPKQGLIRLQYGFLAHSTKPSYESVLSIEQRK